MSIQKRLPLPPFTMETALQKVAIAQESWNSKHPENSIESNAPETEWIENGVVISGIEKVKQHLTQKWEKGSRPKWKKELWGFRNNRMAVWFENEWQDESGQWFRSTGNELLEFDENGYITKRRASSNDLPINESERKI